RPVALRAAVSAEGSAVASTGSMDIDWRLPWVRETEPTLPRADTPQPGFQWRTPDGVARYRGGFTTEGGPPARTRSIAALQSASAALFCALGTCVADHRSKPA